MTFAEIWEQLLKKKPGMEDVNCPCTITGIALKRLLRQVYDQGWKEGAEESAVKKQSQPMGNVFDCLKENR